MVRRVIHRLCHTNDLDDLVQVAFVKIYENLDSLRDEKVMKAWVCRIAVNAAHDYLRKKKRGSWLSFLAPSDVPEPKLQEAGADKDALEKESLKAMLDSLSPKLRDTIVLYSIEELEVKDIARVLKVPEGTVKSRLSQARDQLRQFIDNKESSVGE